MPTSLPEMLVVEISDYTRSQLTFIQAWADDDPTHRTVLLQGQGFSLWTSRVELAPFLFPETPTPTPATCSVCQDYHDRYIAAYTDRAIIIGRDWDAHIKADHPRRS